MLVFAVAFLNELSNAGLRIWTDENGAWWFMLQPGTEPEGGYWGLGECLRAVLIAYVRKS